MCGCTCVSGCVDNVWGHPTCKVGSVSRKESSITQYLSTCVCVEGRAPVSLHGCMRVSGCMSAWGCGETSLPTVLQRCGHGIINSSATVRSFGQTSNFFIELFNFEVGLQPK